VTGLLRDMTFKPPIQRPPSRVLCWEAIALDPQPRVQAFRLPDGTVQRGMVLTRPCTTADCDHPLQVQVAVDRIVTWPSSWRVTL
jgi:hypothetical protein